MEKWESTKVQKEQKEKSRKGVKLKSKETGKPKDRNVEEWGTTKVEKRKKEEGGNEKA